MTDLTENLNVFIDNYGIGRLENSSLPYSCK